MMALVAARGVGVTRGERFALAVSDAIVAAVAGRAARRAARRDDAACRVRRESALRAAREDVWARAHRLGLR